VRNDLQLPGSDAVIHQRSATEIASNFLARDRKSLPILMGHPAHVPDDVTGRVENDATMVEYRNAKGMACTDLLIATKKPDGKYGVVLSRRKKTDPFGGFWWMHGGSIGAYMSIESFIATRAPKESGVKVKPQVLIGVYYTSAEDFPQSTIQPLYASLVPHDALANVTTDANHDSIRTFTTEDLGQLSREERHWYPMSTSMLLLKVLTDTGVEP